MEAIVLVLRTMTVPHLLQVVLQLVLLVVMDYVKVVVTLVHLIMIVLLVRDVTTVCAYVMEDVL